MPVTRTALLTVLLALVFVPSARAGISVPDWVHEAAKAPLPSHDDEAETVVLLHEESIVIHENGEMDQMIREVRRILRPNGREKYRKFDVGYRTDTRLVALHGWAMNRAGQEFEVKEKDAVEGKYGDYTDYKFKELTIPGVEVGGLVAVECQERLRPFYYQDSFRFQEMDPVVRARYSLTLPPGWEYDEFWANHTKIPSQATGNTTVWEIRDIPGLKREDDMPPLRAIAARLVVNFFPAQPELRSKSHSSWMAVARWYMGLTVDRRQSTPELKAKVAELTSGSQSTYEKIRALTAFAQREVRYAAIEIGIGGFQPHAAGEILKNRYGDCKDKAALLSTMLHEIGVESYYVAINTTRGSVLPDIPSATSFNHVILAIQVPADPKKDSLYAIVRHPTLGDILFIDPTNEYTPVGYIPEYLQASYGLLMTADRADLIKLPLLDPAVNRLQRVGNLQLADDGTLTGEVEEIRTGNFAAQARRRLLHAQLSDRIQVVENFLNSFLGQFRLVKASVANLELYDRELVLTYRFEARGYGKSAGPLLLVRPSVLGEKSVQLIEPGKTRTYPAEFEHATYETDRFSIQLPPGYVPDELPDELHLKNDYAEYNSKVMSTGNSLVYERNYKLKQILVPTEKLLDMQKFYRYVAGDERNTAVLKRAGASGGN